MDRRRYLIWSAACALLLLAAPAASDPRGASLLSAPFRPVTRVLLTAQREPSDAEKMRATAINREVVSHPELAIAAPQFTLAASKSDPFISTTALDCLTAAVYFEAANEPITGQRAVAQVVINRLRHPAFPDSVCDVVFQGSERTTGCQFTFTCDGSLRRLPSLPLWQRARSVAAAALGGFVETSVGHATHYHASYVVPYWAPKLTKLTTIGSHIFYQWNGNWSQPSAFSDRYASREALPQGARIALTGYLVSPDPDRMQPSMAKATAPLPAPDSLVPSGLIAKAEFGLAPLPSGLSAEPASSLKVGKSELIESRARLKDDGPLSVRTEDTAPSLERR